MTLYVYNPFTNNLDAIGDNNFPDPVPVADGGTGRSSLTAHSVLIGEGTSPVNFAGPSASSGIPLISQGAASDPIFGTATVPGGGTGAVTLTNHGVVIGQGTSAVAVTSAGTSGQLLQSGGASADPAYTTSTYPSTNAAGDIIYGSGSNAYSNLTVGAIPGQILLSNGTSPAYFSPFTDTYLFDDFLGGVQTNAVPNQMFQFVTGGTTGGTVSNSTTFSDGNHPGIFELFTGINAAGFAGLRLFGNSTSACGIVLGTGALTCIWLMRISALSVNGDAYTIRLGITNANSNSGPSQGLWFSYTDTGATPNWVINSSGGSTTSSTAVATGWHSLRIDVNAANTSATFYVDGVSIGTRSSGMPSAAIGPQCHIVKSSGATSISLYVDFFYLYQHFSSTRGP